MENKIDIKLNNGFHLIAEQNADPLYQNEIMIYITNKDDVIIQDLATVRYLDDSNKFEVIVFANKDKEDNTDKFKKELYKEEE